MAATHHIRNKSQIHYFFRVVGSLVFIFAGFMSYRAADLDITIIDQYLTQRALAVKKPNTRVALANLGSLSSVADANVLEKLHIFLEALQYTKIETIAIISPVMFQESLTENLSAEKTLIIDDINELQMQGKKVVLGLEVANEPYQRYRKPGRNMMSISIKRPNNEAYLAIKSLGFPPIPQLSNERVNFQNSWASELPVAWLENMKTQVATLGTQYQKKWYIHLSSALALLSRNVEIADAIQLLGHSSTQTQGQLIADNSGQLIFHSEYEHPIYSTADALQNSKKDIQVVLIGHEDNQALIGVANLLSSMNGSHYLYSPWWVKSVIVGIFSLLLLIWNLRYFYLHKFLYKQMTILSALTLVGLEIIALFYLNWWIPFHFALVGFLMMAWITAKTSHHLIYLQDLSKQLIAKKQLLTETLIKSGDYLEAKMQASELIREGKATTTMLLNLAQSLESENYLDDAMEIYSTLVYSEKKDIARAKLSKLSSEKTVIIANNLPPSSSLPATGNYLLNEKKHIGRYELKSIIGKGAMGTVFLASDPKINRQVALKTITIDTDLNTADIQSAKDRFVREANAAGKLRHHNIVTIYDIDSDEGMMYIAMDYVPGFNLAESIKRNKFIGIADVYNIILQVAYALKYAHAQGVVHRDIKPGNILFDPKQKHVTVTDFGIALIADHSNTRTGTVLGSPAYMSPEQVKGEKVSGKTDVYSLGVTFYQLLTHQLPFKGDTIASLSFNIVNKKYAPIRQYREKLPRSAELIVSKTLQKNAQQRCTISDLILLLERELERSKK